MQGCHKPSICKIVQHVWDKIKQSSHETKYAYILSHGIWGVCILLPSSASIASPHGPRRLHPWPALTSIALTTQPGEKRSQWTQAPCLTPSLISHYTPLAAPSGMIASKDSLLYLQIIVSKTKQYKSKNNTQWWMWLMLEARSDAVKSNIALEAGMSGPWIKANWEWSNRRWQEWTSTF